MKNTLEKHHAKGPAALFNSDINNVQSVVHSLLTVHKFLFPSFDRYATALTQGTAISNQT